eukprot:scaffold90127_cov63-Phaeocystis_antarctica.AAC.5
MVRPTQDASNHGDLTQEKRTAKPSARSCDRHPARSACHKGRNAAMPAPSPHSSIQLRDMLPTRSMSPVAITTMPCSSRSCRMPVT